uniref:Uncharacterized protein n=1 Tax=Arundo donax TaxID=35708 RepID=A0A0A9BYA4_ARUDO
MLHSELSWQWGCTTTGCDTPTRRTRSTS